MKLQPIHLRINDAATRQPTPVRLRVTDSAGNYYAPFGHAAEFPLGRGEAVGGDVIIGTDRWACIDGSCEIAVPPGELIIEAAKGPEYRPLREVVHLPPGKLALRFAIERWIDSRHDGWYSADTRAHFLPPHTALLEAASEDLAVVNLLACDATLQASDGQTYVTNSNIHAFSGQQPCLERNGHMVVVNTHNRHPVLGQLGLLDCHRVVYPLSFGSPDATDDWSLADWCRQCHRKRGLAIWTNAFAETGFAGEALANAINGDIDALELDLTRPARLRAWYHLLNAGVRAPIVAASAKDSNRTPLGAQRTYARLDPGQSFDYGNWVAAVKAGRTYATIGPLLHLRVEDQLPGAVIRRSTDGPPIRLTFGADSSAPAEPVEVIVNGSVVASGRGTDNACEVNLPNGGWVAARCLAGSRLLAHTSPVYVEVAGVMRPIDSAAGAFLDGHLLRTRDWIVSEGRFNNSKSRDHLVEIIDTARQRLARPPSSA